MMTFDIDGKPYEFDQNKLALAESIMVHEESGLTIADFNTGLQNMHPLALKSMVWLAKRRAGEAVRYKDIEFDVIAFANSITNEDPAGATTDPTEVPLSPDGSNNGTNPASDAPNTSEPSPTTSG